MRFHLLVAEGPDGRYVGCEGCASEAEMENDPESWADALEAARAEAREAQAGNRMANRAFGVLTLDVPDADVQAALRRGSVRP